MNHNSINLERALVATGLETICGRGTCMFPFVRPGDILNIKTCELNEVKLGDIAVFRRSSTLIAHRVVDNGVLDGRDYLITKGDRNFKADILPVYKDIFIGIVDNVIRKGHRVTPERLIDITRISASNHIIVFLLDKKINATYRLRVFLKNRAHHLLPFKILSECWIRFSSKLYSVRIPLNETLGYMLYRTFDLDSFCPKSAFGNRFPQFFRLTVHLNRSNKPDGYVDIVRNNAFENWKVKEMFIRIRYQWTNLSKELLARAELIVDQEINA